MANPLLALQVQPANIDVAGSMARGQEMQTARLGNILQQYKLQQAQAADQRSNTLAALTQRLGPGLASGDPNALAEYARLDPEGAQGFQGKALEQQKTQGDIKANDIKIASDRAEFIGRAAAGVLEAPEAARPLLYQRALQQAKDLGVDVAGAPQQYDEAAVKGMMDQALTVKQRIDAHLAQETAAATKAKDDRDFAYRGTNDAANRGVTLRGQNLTDARSRERIAKGSGMRLTTNPDGSVEFVQGDGGGGLGPAAQNTVQGKILSAGDTLAGIGAIKARAKPEYQTIGTRWNNLTTAWKEKGGIGVDPKDQQALNDFTEYRATAGQLFSQTLKELSGAAVAPPEMKRAEGWLPNPGTGLMDGDSPTQLKAKIERFEDFTKKALAKYQYINKHGLSVDDVDVDAMPQIMQKRGDALAKKYEAEGLTGKALTNAVKGDLVEEFGIGVR